MSTASWNDCAGASSCCCCCVLALCRTVLALPTLSASPPLPAQQSKSHRNSADRAAPRSDAAERCAAARRPRLPATSSGAHARARADSTAAGLRLPSLSCFCARSPPYRAVPKAVCSCRVPGTHSATDAFGSTRMRRSRCSDAIGVPNLRNQTSLERLVLERGCVCAHRRTPLPFPSLCAKPSQAKPSQAKPSQAKPIRLGCRVCPSGGTCPRSQLTWVHYWYV